MITFEVFSSKLSKVMDLIMLYLKTWKSYVIK